MTCGLGDALLDDAVEQLVGAERAARLGHTGRLLAVAAEDHLELDEILARHDAGRRRSAAARWRSASVSCCASASGTSTGSMPEHRHAGRRRAACGARRRRQNRGDRGNGQSVATHCRALYTEGRNASVDLRQDLRRLSGRAGDVRRGGHSTTWSPCAHLGDELRLVSRGYLELRLRRERALARASQPARGAGRAAVQAGAGARRRTWSSSPSTTRGAAASRSRCRRCWRRCASSRRCARRPRSTRSCIQVRTRLRAHRGRLSRRRGAVRRVVRAHRRRLAAGATIPSARAARASGCCGARSDQARPAQRLGSSSSCARRQASLRLERRRTAPCGRRCSWR